MTKIFEKLKKNISDIAEVNNISKNNLEYFLYPNKVIEVNIPVKMDNWKIKNFVGYRSQHNNIKGPYKKLATRKLICFSDEMGVAKTFFFLFLKNILQTSLELDLLFSIMLLLLL